MYPDSQPYAGIDLYGNQNSLVKRIKCDQLRQVAQIRLNPLITEIGV